MNGHRGTHGTLSGRLSIERKKGVIEGPNGLHSHRWRVQAQSGACLRGRATEGKNVGRWRVLRLQRWAQKTPSTGVRAGPGQHLPTKENKKHFSERAYLVSSSQNGSFGVKIWIGRAKRGRSGERAPAARPHNKNGSGCGKAGGQLGPQANNSAERSNTRASDTSSHAHTLSTKRTGYSAARRLIWPSWPCPRARSTSHAPHRAGVGVPPEMPWGRGRARLRRRASHGRALARPVLPSCPTLTLPSLQRDANAYRASGASPEGPGLPPAPPRGLGAAPG